MGSIFRRTSLATWVLLSSATILLGGGGNGCENGFGGCSTSTVEAFIVAPSVSSSPPRDGSSFATSRFSRKTQQNLSTESDDCGCAPATAQTLYSGKPSDRARNDINPREAIRQSTFQNLEGESVTMDDIIGPPTSEISSPTSIVVFLRSLG